VLDCATRPKAAILGIMCRAFGNLPRSESWYPYVFTSPEEAEEAGFCSCLIPQSTKSMTTPSRRSIKPANCPKFGAATLLNTAL